MCAVTVDLPGETTLRMSSRHEPQSTIFLTEWFRPWALSFVFVVFHSLEQLRKGAAYGTQRVAEAREQQKHKRSRIVSNPCFPPVMRSLRKRSEGVAVQR